MLLAASNSDKLLSWLKLPITKVTAMVSPKARPRPSMMPPTTPVLVYGSTTLNTTSQVVEPSAYADSFSMVGVTSNTSRITEAMNGMIMIARMMPADKMPMPTGAPDTNVLSTGTSANSFCSGCCT